MQLIYQDPKTNAEVTKTGTASQVGEMAKKLLRPSRGLTFWKSSEPVTETFTVARPIKNVNGNDDVDTLSVRRSSYGMLEYDFRQGSGLQGTDSVFTTVEELTRNGGVIDRFLAGTLTKGEQPVFNTKPAKRPPPPPGYTPGIYASGPLPISVSAPAVSMVNANGIHHARKKRPTGGRRRRVTRRMRKSKKHTRKH